MGLGTARLRTQPMFALSEERTFRNVRRTSTTQKALRLVVEKIFDSSFSSPSVTVAIYCSNWSRIGQARAPD
jgi:hypothetical protein